jgi:nitroimidazol reductase NimA-like FMN-containing flavoprotein (pyridoxamine 5'-phosphate oxidase superfamily)
VRRKDREIADRRELEAILEEADVARLAFASGGAPYIVPLNYGFAWERELVLYFHGANEGRKIREMRKGGLVGFELDTGHELIVGDGACDWGMKYRSIVGSGRLSEVTEPAERKAGLDAIMEHYGFPGSPAYDERMFAVTVLLKLEVVELSGKQKLD